jgi:flagellar biosynthesis component FlhA
VVELKLVVLLLAGVFAALWPVQRGGLFVLVLMIVVVLLVLPRHPASAPLVDLFLCLGCEEVHLGWLVVLRVVWHREARVWFHLYTAVLLQELLVRVALSWQRAALLRGEGGENRVEEAVVGGLSLS